MNPERKKNEVLKGEIIERKIGWYWSGKVESKKANKAAVRGHADQPGDACLGSKLQQRK